MRVVKYLLIGLASIFFISAGNAQEWGPMNFIDWQNPTNFGIPGIFNPSYTNDDSILYFDTFFRLEFDDGAIYSTRLSENGIWTDPVLLPEPINFPDDPDIINAMPGITSGGDTLFFCSDRYGTYGGLDIWMSVKEGENWSEPVNLGDSINSELHELKPQYISETNTLYFDRLEIPSFYRFAIYRSEYLGENIWQHPERLPDIINVPERTCYGAFFDEFNATLYFSKVHPEYGFCIYEAYFINGNWNEPQRLSDNVNGMWMPNICDYHETENPWLSSDGQLLFYNKWIWEYTCIDFTVWLFYSEKTVNIEGTDDAENHYTFSFNVYPNPSNSSFKFQINGLNKQLILKIYNLRGQLVSELSIYDSLPVEWAGTDQNGNKVTSGIYFAVLEFGGEKQVRKVVLLK